MQSAESSQISPRPRFPNLDPEPPPHPWRRAGAALAVLLAALGSWLGYTLSSTTPQHSATASVPFARGLAGVILAETPGSNLFETDMRSGKVVMFKKLGQFSSNPDPAVSADGRYLVDVATARVLSLASFDHPQAVPNALSFSPVNMPGFMPYPWSNDDTSVVEVSYPLGAAYLPSTIPVATVESVQTGRAVSLGPADAAAGDPQREGAFIAIPGTGKPYPNGSEPDTSLVLADAGLLPHLLATTGQLNSVLGNSDGTAESLVPIPNPQGSMVAVDVSSMTGGSAGVVVLSRNGALLGSQPGLSTGWAGWSHSGRTLAMVGYRKSGLELTEWTVGARTVTTALRDSSRIGPTACAWSPDDAAVICDGGPRGSWLLIRSGTESVIAGQGQPIVWENGRLGG